GRRGQRHGPGHRQAHRRTTRRPDRCGIPARPWRHLHHRPARRRRGDPMTHKDILLVEDNPDDIELTRIAFDEAKVANRLVVVRDGAEALDYIFARGEHADRDPGDLPSIVLLDLNLPKVDGREVL